MIAGTYSLADKIVNLIIISMIGDIPAALRYHMKFMERMSAVNSWSENKMNL